jgi:outer membrane protein assembly factor BamA
MNLSPVKEKHLKAWTGLKAGSPFDHVANQEAVRRIEQEYHDKGYYFVKVELVKGSKSWRTRSRFSNQRRPQSSGQRTNVRGQ